MGFKSRGYSLNDLRDLLHYDERTGVFTWRVQAGNRAKAGDRAGSHQKSSGYRVISVGGKLYREHRLAWIYVHGNLPSGDIDHINGVRDDNRIANLRLATHAENMQNKKKAHKNNKIGFIGVGLDRGRFRARINIEGQQIFIGHFESAEEASIAYMKAKNLLHVGSGR